MWVQNEKNILIMGHRGIKAFYPENTMVSFKKAIEIGVDGIELDINMTKDGHLVVIHDNTVDRTTNGSGKVMDLTLKEIKDLDAGSHYDEEYKNEKIPTFKEFIELVKEEPLLLNVEIKDYRLSVVDKTIAMLEEYNLSDRYVITCFNSDVTSYAHSRYNVKTQGFQKKLVKNYKNDTYNHYYSVGIRMDDLSKELCDEFKQMNIDTWCWSPDDEEGINKAIESGVTMVTVNNPFPALSVLKEKGLHK